MAVAARQVQIATGKDHAIAVEKKVVVDRELGVAAEVENVAVAVQMDDGRVGVARHQRIRAVQFSEHGGTFQRFSGVGQIKEAKEHTSNKGKLSLKLCEICCGSGLCLLFMLIFGLLLVAALIIGSVYLTRCEFFSGQSNTNVPIWLIVFGSVGLIQIIVRLCRQCCLCICKNSDDEDEGNMSTIISRCGYGCDSFFVTFQVIWLIVGSVWVFGVFDDYQQSVGGVCIACCHNVPYLFSFVILILIYIFGGLCCLTACCCCICYICVSVSED